jgi:hypothetical protein
MPSIETNRTHRPDLLAYLRTGHHPGAAYFARKYNHNHDPANGQFTFGSGGGGGSDSFGGSGRGSGSRQGGAKPDGGTALPRLPLASSSPLAQATGLKPSTPKPTQPQAERGPFQMHANATHQGGDVVRGLNKIATTPNSTTTIKYKDTTLKVTTLNVTRDTGDIISLDIAVSKSNIIHATGKLKRTPGKQELTFEELQFNTDKSRVGLMSPPTKIIFSARNNGDLVYTIDKPLQGGIKTPFGIVAVGKPKPAGSYYIYDSRKK